MKQRILTVLGTRPEIIRLSVIIPKLDAISEHRVLHTGQNYDPLLNQVFFEQLNIRTPDHVIDGKKQTFANQVAMILIQVESYIADFKPDKILILGDTNSGLSAIVSERMGIPVYHMEAGNRCFDREVPEELNRKLIDGAASFNLPYTFNSKQNLLNEGHSRNRIRVIGNPIGEVISYYQSQIDHSVILESLNLVRDNYLLATIHRAENVDREERLNDIVGSLIKMSEDMPVVLSCHPRTRSKLEQFKIDIGSIMMTNPLGFMDFVKLEQQARLVVTDSGTVCEEACLFHVPCVTTRNSTERPETVQCNANRVAGVTLPGIMNAYDVMMQSVRDWKLPDEYRWTDVSDRVIDILISE